MATRLRGPGLDPESFARDLTTRVVPAVLTAEHTEAPSSDMVGRWDSRTAGLADLYQRDRPDEHADALLDAASQFRPPDSLVGADDTYGVLMGALAFRAATSELLQEPDIRQRYQRAASWVCVNLGSIIWWNCD